MDLATGVGVGAGARSVAAMFTQHQPSEVSEVVPPPPMQDLSQLIRLKERELHEIHDLRCGQLERLVEERNQAAVESRRQFELLRDDFQYNLTLLEARDQEIRRLEAVLTDKSTTIEENEAHIRGLTGKIDRMEVMELERVEKLAQDKATNRVGSTVHDSFMLNEPWLLVQCSMLNITNNWYARSFSLLFVRKYSRI